MHSKLLLLEGIYELINSGIKIWVHNNTVKVFVPEGALFTTKQKDFIKLNKDNILDVLKDSGIYSKEYNTIVINSKLNYAPLSFVQQRLWFIERYEKGTNAYNIPMVFKLANNVQLDILYQSITATITRHEILRTLIKEDSGGNYYQSILELEENPLKIINIEVLTQAELDQALSKEINHIYNLSNEYPIRICLYKLFNNNIQDYNEQYYLSIVIHHIAFDGWSADIFLKELRTHYNHYLESSGGLVTNLELPHLGIQYKDFALWQRSYLNNRRLAQQLSYWKGKLEGYETLNLITDNQRPKQVDYRGQDIYFELDEPTSNSLKELAKELNVSLFSLLLGGYYLMLRAYSNQDDIVIGTPVANRHYNQVEDLIGFFVNSLALRIQIDSEVLIKDFIQNINQEIIGAQIFQDLPFEKLVEELKISRDTSKHPIFQVMFGVQRFGNELFSTTEQHVQDTQTSKVLQAYSDVLNLYKVAKFDLCAFIDDSHPKLIGNFNYAISLYTQETIVRFIETYTEILRQFAVAYNTKTQEQIKIKDLHYLTKKQYQQIITNWNQTEAEYPNNKTIHQLFEKQVKQTPDNIALVFKEIRLTYRELNERANRLAHYLRRVYDIKSDILVALCLDRSEHMLIAILAVLKAGGAYVPMDPSYPDERVNYILRDTATKLVLTNEHYKQKLQDLVSQVNLSAEIIAVDSDTIQEQLLLQQVINPKTETKSTDLAYVIYTSGTTGQPKGVIQLHTNIMRLFTATDQWYQFNDNDVWVLFHSYVFDFSVWEIWGALLYGGKLIIPSYKQIMDFYKFFELCKREKLTVLNQTPNAFYQFASIAISKAPNDKLVDLRYIIFGGEALNLAQLKPWVDCYGYNKPKLINMYGITETTVHVTYKEIIEGDVEGSSCIGKIIPDLKAYVLGTNLNILPIGAIGELYIGGRGLARGYLNRADLTAQKFITNPFQTEQEKRFDKNAKLYKTGDLVRWLPNGNLEYIGRNDFQVKIRGYRIELGEIENALSSYEGIKQSVVLIKEYKDSIGTGGGNKYLVGYYVSDNQLNKEAIIIYLHTKLPDYMVPNILVYLEKFPLTINGKLDTKALPNPEFANKDSYAEPRNDLEMAMCKVWVELLGLPECRIGIYDNFFKLGSNSLTTIKAVVHINKTFNTSLAIKDIFLHPSVSQLCSFIEKKVPTADIH